MPCVIPLTRGYETLVDARDYAWLTQWRWQAQVVVGGIYASRTCYENGKKIRIYMHRLITNCPLKMEAHHRDKDGLNNQRYNLVVSTRSQNAHARDLPLGVCGYRGVWRDRGKFRATINIAGERRSLGQFPTALEAAQAYDLAAREAFGEFAELNFQEEPLVLEEIPF